MALSLLPSSAQRIALRGTTLRLRLGFDLNLGGGGGCHELGATPLARQVLVQQGSVAGVQEEGHQEDHRAALDETHGYCIVHVGADGGEAEVDDQPTEEDEVVDTGVGHQG